MEEAAQHIIAELLDVFPAERDEPFSPIVNSTQGSEPYEVASDFQDKRRWAGLSPEWLDASPGGLATALSFLSDEAVCFYIPAYITADLRGLLVRAEPVFHLTHGFDNFSRDKRIWPRSLETWTAYSSQRWSHLTTSQALAIVHYLEWRVGKDGKDLESSAIEALSAFWYNRASLNPKGS